jgi:multiple sugar transport system permease protein
MSEPSLVPFDATRIRSRRRRHLRQWGTAYLLILPAFVLLVAMMAVPVVQTFVFSFSEVRLPRLDVVFVGFQNFLDVFTDRDTLAILRNTIIWVVGALALRMVLGFLAALVFNARVRGTMWLRVLVVLPWAIPSVVGANLWVWLMQPDIGLINNTLRAWGLGDLAQNWLSDPNIALTAVIIAYTWSGVPFVMLMLLAGMQGIPKEYYEAAMMDGANAWKSFRYITLPSLKGVLVVVTILEIVHAINSFDTIMIMTAGGPANATLLWGLDIYRVGFGEFDFGGAAARSVLLFLAGLIVFLFYATASRRTALKGNR